MKNAYAAFDWKPQSETECGHLAVQEKYSASLWERLFFLVFGIVSYEVVMASTQSGRIEVHTETHICVPRWTPPWLRVLLHSQPRITKLVIDKPEQAQCGERFSGLG